MPAVRRDPRVSVVVTSRGSGIRVVLEVGPEGRIGFDSTQMWQDTPDAARRD